MRIRALAMVAGLALAFLIASFASADPVADPQGDVQDHGLCGECTNYGQDLKSIDATGSGGDVTFTIVQYDSMNNAFAASYYGPQVGIFTSGGATPDFAILPRQDGQNHWKPTLVPAAKQVAPCSSTSVYGEGVTASYDAGFTTATYTIHLADIGNPASFQWKVANPTVPGCNFEPDNEARDIAPDSGLVSFAGTSTNTTTTTTTTTGTTPTTTDTTTTTTPLTPQQTLPSLSGIPSTQKLGGSIGGTLNLAGPAASVTIDALAPSGGAANAAALKLIGHLVKTNVPKGALPFRVKLNAKAVKRLKAAKKPRVTVRVTVKLADGKSTTHTTVVKLKRK